MEATGQSSRGPAASDTVRRYFARLKLHSQPEVIASGWAQLPVESYFVALRQPPRLINTERRPATDSIESLGSLFESVRWA